MNMLKKSLVVGTSSLMALSGLAGVAVAAPASEDVPDQNQAAESVAASVETSIVKTDVVAGTFAFTQTEVTSLSDMMKNLATAAKYLCGANAQVSQQIDAAEWLVTINGAVKEPVVATFDELVDSAGTKQMIMGCSCAGNPSAGLATINAEVTGIGINNLLEMAQPAEEANTIVFTSADGYSVALPLYYVTTHFSSLVFDVNGSPIVDAVGGTNQLWLGSTPASYFARDIVSITLENRVTPPPSPTSDEAREALGTLPNVGVIFGGEVH